MPALVELCFVAARWLGVSPELVSLYTWHPPVLENALRMFVLARIEYLGVQLGPSHVCAGTHGASGGAVGTR